MALGNAVTADPPAVMSIHFNPAGLTQHGVPLHELLLSSGAMEGPARPCKTLTVTLLARARRAVRGWLINRRGVAL